MLSFNRYLFSKVMVETKQVIVETVTSIVTAESELQPIKRQKLSDEISVTESSDEQIDLSISLTRGMVSPLFKLLKSPSWASVLESQFSEMYFHDITRFLNKEVNGGGSQKIFPPLPLVFSALNACEFDQIKVVILGQDPYHDDGQAMGLSFSVPSGFKLPSSLLNIYKELETDLDIPRSNCGDLTTWSKQGVLLLNAVLTVRAHQANSHEGKGWERFTDYIIRQISDKLDNVVFMLWGKFAEKKAAKVNCKKHLILKSAHPSGLSASRGFFGCKHFSKANEYLKENGKPAIDWSVPRKDE